MAKAIHGTDELPFDKREMFVEWCKREGFIMDKVKWPAFFGREGDPDEKKLLGLQAKERIEHRESFMSVPMKTIMSIEKARNHPILG